MKRVRAYMLAAAGLFMAALSPMALASGPDQGPAAATRIVVIDPGHGGDDTGAVGPSGVAEKDVALSVALQLAERLRERTDCTVLLTRADDTFIPLKERTRYANDNKADLFISIHANAAVKRDVDGVETFFLSFDATDDEARETAAQENMSAPAGLSPNPAASEDLRDILFDLEKTEAHHESSRLAETIQSSMLKSSRVEDRGVKQAPFAVLNGAAMPAVLVEIGFISNPVEERLLGTRKKQAEVADAIADGVTGFDRETAKGRDYIGFNEKGLKE